jgi:pimeloyl-ACP methyl ester carboxylesterase
LWIYTPRAHQDGTVEKIIEEVLAGGLDMITPPRYGRVVADAIPGARFEVLAEETHQPFQEVPDLFNATVDTFWRQVEARG